MNPMHGMDRSGTCSSFEPRRRMGIPQANFRDLSAGLPTHASGNP